MRRGGAGRVWGYCRVSSAKQEQGTSLEGQRDAIGRWCAAQGLAAPAFAVEVESGTAEKTERRVEQRRLVSEARGGDLVVVYAVDRWSRDLVYTMQSVRALAAKGVRWVAIREAIDASTREGDERLGLMAWIAENERKRIAERTLGRKRELTDDGYYVRGLPPIGYVLRDRKLAPGPEATIVREAFERCAGGAGLLVLTQVLPLTKGRRRWDKAAIGRMLSSRFYLGESPDSAGVWRPTHEPIVDVELYERARAEMQARKQRGRDPRPESWSAERLLRGLARCAKCGRSMAIQLGRVRKGDAGRSMSYVCAGHLAGLCQARHVHAERLDALADHAALDRLRHLHAALVAAKPAPATPPPDDSGAKLTAAKRRRERLISLAVDGTITQTDLRARLAKADAEVAALEHAAAAARRRARAAERAARPEAREALLSTVERLTAAWQHAPVAVRREALRMLAAGIEVVPPPPRVHEVVRPRIAWRTVEDLAAER